MWYDLTMINDIKRLEIEKIAKDEKVRDYFTSIKVFGSTITDRCTEESDIDLFVTLKSNMKMILTLIVLIVIY